MQREDILSCACELFASEGMEGFSMRRLARRLEVTAPAIYRHFESRESVLAEVVGEAYRILRDHLYRALEGSSPEERFRLAGRAYLDFALDHPGFYQVLYASADVLGMERLPEQAAAHACAVGQFWNDRVRECMDAGLLQARDPREAGITLWSHSHGLISLYLLGMLEIDEEAFRVLYRQSSLRLLRGVATDEYRATLSEELAGENVVTPAPPGERAAGRSERS